MNFNKIKGQLSSLNYNLNETKLPEEIRKIQMQNIINDLLQYIEEEEKEYRDIKELAWKLANKM